jgi:hypothetical protein
MATSPADAGQDANENLDQRQTVRTARNEQRFAGFRSRCTIPRAGERCAVVEDAECEDAGQRARASRSPPGPWRHRGPESSAPFQGHFLSVMPRAGRIGSKIAGPAGQTRCESSRSASPHARELGARFHAELSPCAVERCGDRSHRQPPAVCDLFVAVPHRHQRTYP